MKRSLRTGILRGAVLSACLFGFVSKAPGIIWGNDDTLIKDPANRAVVSAAIDAIHKNPGDRPSMEIVLQTVPEAAETIGTPFIYKAKDPLKAEACALIQGDKSVDVLADDTAGSDFMAAWACRKIVSQAWNSDSPTVKAVGGSIDDAAKAKLKAPVLKVLDRKNAPARAVAAHALAYLVPQDELTAILKPLLKDPEPTVATAAVSEFNHFIIYDKEIDASVWTLLSTSDDPEQLVTCCRWWSIVRQRHDKTITPEQEARFVKLATDSHPDVRREVTEAVSEYATAERPTLISLLLQMAHNDSDVRARSYAAYSLRNARTPAVRDDLIKLTNDPEAAVRDGAARVLKEWGDKV